MDPKQFMMVDPEKARAQGMAELHISDIKNHKRCRRLWNWTSPLRENLERKAPYMPFFTGSAFHKMIEMYYKAGQHPDTTLQEFLREELPKMNAGDFSTLQWQMLRDDVAKNVKLVREICAEYLYFANNYTGEFCDADLEYLALEVKYSVPVPAPNEVIKGPAANNPPQHSVFFYLAGKFDGLVRHKPTNTLWLLEHKTCRSIPERMALLSNDTQATAYAWAAQQVLGEPIAGILYNLVRKKVPTRPARLKARGGLSIRKDLDTSPRVFDLVSQRVCGVPAEQSQYAQYYHMLKNNPNTFVCRVPIKRSQEQLQEFAEDLWHIGHEMINPNQRLYPTEDWSCSFCVFKDPCIIKSQGGDFQSILDSDYRQRILDADADDQV